MVVREKLTGCAFTECPRSLLADPHGTASIRRRGFYVRQRRPARAILHSEPHVEWRGFGVRIRRQGGCRQEALDAPVVLALPRGGVPVAAVIAEALGATLDVIVVRKIGAPSQPELALGAIASGGIRVLNQELLDRVGGLDAVSLEAVEAREREELERRERAYRGDRPRPRLVGRDVVLVDDGLATGATMRAAVQAVRACRPARIVVAVPVGSKEAVAGLRGMADRVICPEAPADFYAVGQFYRDFAQTSDDDVRRLLAAAASRGAA